MKIFTMNHSVHGFAAIFSLFGKSNRSSRKSIDDYKQEVLLRQGKAQFEKLLQKGLQIPVALL